MEWEGDDGKGVVVGLIEKATNSTTDLDPRILKSIKSVVRHSDLELRLAVENLMSLMKRDHAQVRYLALTIIHELLMRSKLFRGLIVENLEQLLTLSVGFRRNQPLPAPPAIASKLRLKAIEFLERWNATFGIHYRQLRLGHDYLKNTLRFQFPNLQANAARVQQERRERELRTKEILLNKYELLKSNLPSIKDEVKSIIDEISECLDILQSCKEENVPLSPPIDEEDFEEFRSTELRQIRENSLKEAEKVAENSENKVVFDALRELYKLLVTKHLVAVQESISVLIRVELSDNRVRDSMLKEFIDTRNHLKTIKSKCEEAGCALAITTDEGEGEEEDIWEEEGRSETFDISKPVTTPKPNKQKSEEHANKRNDSGLKRNKKEVCDLDPLKSKLMGEAPVMKWGSFLDNWGSQREFMANQRGLEVEGHWGRVDCDAVIPANKIAELNIQATVYEEEEEEQKEIKECRAPLKKGGGLCSRRDLKVCPFHGPILPRDDQGKPFLDDNNLSAEELVKRAVSNVRERDIKKRELYDKKEMKRAKLAKVRGHNEAVLRDAALASTSGTSSIGEAGRREKNNNNNNSLAKMLKKKVSVKDRLGARLLSRKATARQMNLGDEHSKYREAFPNQW